MAAPIYDTDLTDINLAEVNTDWNDINQAGGGGANEAVIDFAIEGTNCIARQVSNTRRGAVADFGTTITFAGTDDHVFVWTGCSTPGITNIKSAGGIRVTMGTSLAGAGAWYDWYVNGSDTLPQGGIQNYAIYYTGSTASNTNGSPGTAPRYFGSQAVTNNSSRGLNWFCDAIRYGTGFYITEGDATTPITFSGSAAENDNNNNRYGILTAIPGGFALKGRYIIGQDPNQVTTASYFRESNTSLAITDTEYSLPDFTQIVFDHPSTFFSLDTVSFTTIGTNNKGKFMVNDASTTGSIVSCTFNNFGNTNLNANVQVTGSSWIGCEGIQQSGSIIFDSSIIGTADPSGSIISDDPSLISFCTFEGDGTHHGIEVVVTGSYSFAGNQFSGFISGSNGGEELLFNPPGGTGDLTLNIVEGGSNLEFKNLSSGTVTINAQTQVTLTSVVSGSRIKIYEAGTDTEVAGDESSPASGEFAFNATSGGSVDIVIVNNLYVYFRINGYSVPLTSATLPISQQFDRNYSNP